MKHPDREPYTDPACLEFIRNRFAPSWAILDWKQTAGLVSLIMALREHFPKGKTHTMVELGTSAGESGVMFAAAGIFSKIYHIDSWCAEHSNEAGKKICAYNLERYPGSEMIHRDMFELEKEWDQRLDMIYLDADHTYPEVKKGLEAWDKHLRSGGIWAGHDYTSVWPGVIQAVDEFFPGLCNFQFYFYDRISSRYYGKEFVYY